MRPLGSLKNKTTKTKSMAASSDDNYIHETYKLNYFLLIFLQRL